MNEVRGNASERSKGKGKGANLSRNGTRSIGPPLPFDADARRELVANRIWFTMDS